MEISPFMMLSLLIEAVRWGVKIGLLCDFNRFVRMALHLEEMDESMRSRYEKPLPLVKRPLKWRTMSKGKRRIRGCVLFLQDVFLLATTGVGIVVLNYTFNDGKNRLITLVGTAVGFFLCRASVGRIIGKLLERGLFWIECSFSVLFYIIFHPICKILNFLCEKMNKIRKNMWKSIANKKKKEYNLYVKRYFLQKAENGFLNQKK